jgi:lipoprotein-anchoring transpeptidase ErfK/SrfK
MKMRRLFALLIVIAALVAPLPTSAREVVAFQGYAPGSVVIVTHARELYYVLGQGQAIRYPVAVGKAGMAWQSLGRAKTNESGLAGAAGAWRRARYSRRLAAQSNGRCGAGFESRQLRHPRHQ